MPLEWQVGANIEIRDQKPRLLYGSVPVCINWTLTASFRIRVNEVIHRPKPSSGSYARIRFEGIYIKATLWTKKWIFTSLNHHCSAAISFQILFTEPTNQNLRLQFKMCLELNIVQLTKISWRETNSSLKM